MDCNRYILFRSANISPGLYPTVALQGEFWQEAFHRESTPLDEKDYEVIYPYDRKESHQKESEQFLYHHLLEILEDRGGKIQERSSFDFAIPTELPEVVKTVSIAKCFFCDSGVIKRQFVFEYENILVFYNIRKGAKPGCNFLILPRRHTQKIYGLTPVEIENIRIVRGALVEVLKESYPGSEVVVYIQDDPSIGQTVFHSHEQVVVVDPKVIPLTWTMMCLYPTGNVSEEEMESVKEEFSQKLQDKMSRIKLLAKEG